MKPVVEPLDATLGAVVTGVSLAQLTDDVVLGNIAKLNVGIAMSYLGRLPEAMDHLESAYQGLKEARPALAYHARLGQLCCAAPNAPDEWDTRYAAVSTGSGPQVGARESVWHALNAATRWGSTGDEIRMKQAIELVLSLLPAGFSRDDGSQLA